MLIRKFEGDYYENGVALGKDLRQSGYSPPVLTEDRLKLADQCEKAVKQYTPNLIDELNGIIEGGNYDDTHLRAFSLALTKYPQLGCSIFAISKRFTKNARTIFCRNYDWDKWVAEFSVLWKSYPEEALASISGTDLFVGRYGGLNESGLAIAVTAIRGYTEDAAGVALHYVVRWILDTCRNVSEATSFLRRVPHFRGNNYLLADSTDAITYVEATPKRVMVVDKTEAGFAVVTNHFRSQETMIYENKELRSITSVPRLNLIKNWFNSQSNTEISKSHVQEVLSDKLESKIGVCQDNSYFLSDQEVPYGTIWSWTAYPGDRYIELTHKTYNGKKFEKYDF